MGYLYLLAAIVFEILGTTAMKMSNGFSLLLPTLGTIFFYAVCFTFLSFSLKTIEVGIAYAIWSAVGLMIIALIGIMFFHETINTLKIISLLLIVLGVIGLNLSGIKH